MAEDPKSCDRCGETHVRCSAHTKAGRPCGQPPRNGQSVCRKHGGNAPQALAKAEERQTEQAADATIKKLWPGLANATPVTDPVASLARMAGALETAVDVVGERVNGLKHLEGGANLTQLRGEVVLLEKLLAQLRPALDSMARLGIAERQVQLQQDQAEVVVAAFRAALGVVASALLTPGDKDLMLRTFLRGLGVELPDELEAGVVA